jgi:transposase
MTGAGAGGAGERSSRARKAFVEAEAPRVQCIMRHGVIVAAVPWAQHDSSFTRGFEDRCAWLAVKPRPMRWRR